MAREITTLLHGADACTKAEAASQALFSGDVRAIDPGMLDDIFAATPSVELDRKPLEGAGINIVDLLVMTELATSKRQARECLADRAITVNGDIVTAEANVTRTDLLQGSLILVRRGKREWRVARFG